MAADTDADAESDTDKKTVTASEGSFLDPLQDMVQNRDLPEFAIPLAAGIILVLVIGLGAYMASGDAEPAATEDLPIDDVGEDAPDDVSALLERIEELETAVACNAAADDINREYCSQFVRGSEGTSDPTFERCGNLRDQRSSRYAHTASEMGCDWTEQLDDAGSITVNGETVDCVAQGYIEPECPA